MEGWKPWVSGNNGSPEPKPLSTPIGKAEESGSSHWKVNLSVPPCPIRSPEGALGSSPSSAGPWEPQGLQHNAHQMEPSTAATPFQAGGHRSIWDFLAGLAQPARRAQEKAPMKCVNARRQVTQGAPAGGLGGALHAGCQVRGGGPCWGWGRGPLPTGLLSCALFHQSPHSRPYSGAHFASEETESPGG